MGLAMTTPDDLPALSARLAQRMESLARELMGEAPTGEGREGLGLFRRQGNVRMKHEIRGGNVKSSYDEQPRVERRRLEAGSGEGLAEVLEGLGTGFQGARPCR